EYIKAHWSGISTLEVSIWFTVFLEVNPDNADPRLVDKIAELAQQRTALRLKRDWAASLGEVAVVDDPTEMTKPAVQSLVHFAQFPESKNRAQDHLVALLQDPNVFI